MESEPCLYNSCLLDPSQDGGRNRLALVQPLRARGVQEFEDFTFLHIHVWTRSRSDSHQRLDSVAAGLQPFLATRP